MKTDIISGFGLYLDYLEKLPEPTGGDSEIYTNLVQWNLDGIAIWFRKDQLPIMTKIFAEAAAKYPVPVAEATLENTISPEEVDAFTQS